MRCVLGFDGGGTKTDCVLMDETRSIRARARCGPCNPVLVGEQAAANALLAGGEEACAAAGALPEEVLFISGGVAGLGAGRGFPLLVEKLQTKFLNAHVSLLSDLAMALAATRETPSVVVIAGTGSSVYGRDANGATAREGGLGAILGDPGSAYDIGRKAMVEQLRHELDGNSSALRNQILQHFACSWPELQEKLRANPGNVLPRIFPLVVEAANGGEATAQELLRSSAVELAALGERVVAKLKLNNTAFLFAKTGGVFGRSTNFDEAFDNGVRAFAPLARVASLPTPVAEYAARSVAGYLAGSLRRAGS
jgi:N-acetylglucosamine kinase-like BadF-type ATPase